MSAGETLSVYCLSRYVRALGALYMRLVGTSLDCYKYLEPLYLDYRKLKQLNKLGGKQLLDKLLLFMFCS